MDSMITIGKKKLRTLYQKIRAGKPISLENCIVKGFSLSEYRDIYKQLKNSRAANEVQHYYLAWVGILLGTIVGVISFTVEAILLDIMCGAYATKPFKFLCSVLLLIMGFAGSYALLNHNTAVFSFGTAVPSASPLILAVYFSFFQFFQVDCGITVISPIAHTISLVQKTIGMIILAVFTVSYTRKIIK